MRLIGRAAMLAMLAFAVQGHFALVKAESLTVDHVHLAVPDPAKAAAWYVKYLGGVKTGANEVSFGPTRLLFQQSPNAVPSARSAIDFIGFSFENIDAKMAELQAAGIKIVMATRQIPKMFKIAYVEDPWGVKVEIVQDLDLLGFHHIHFRASEPDALVAWLVRTLGGERGKVGGQLDALRYGRLWVVTQKAPEAPAPSAGSALDHVAWRVANLKAMTAALRADGVTLTAGASTPLESAFVEGPAGLRVELVQR